MVAHGLGSFLCIGTSTTAFGTAPTLPAGFANKCWYRVTEGFDSLALDRTVIPFEDLSDYDHLTGPMTMGQRKVEGSVTFRLTYDRIFDLLRLLTGHNATVTISPVTFTPVAYNSSSHYTHGTTPLQLMFEVNKGHANSIFYHGLMLNEAEFKFEQDEFLTCTLSVVGGGYQIAAKTTPTFNDTNLIRMPTGQAGRSVDLGGAQFIARSSTVRIGHNLDARRDLSTFEPLLSHPNAKRDVEFEVEIELDDETFLNKVDDAKANRFTSGYIDVAESTYQLKFNFNELVVKSPAERRVNSVGVVTATIAMMARSDGSTPAYTVTGNSPSTAYAT